MGLVTLFNWLMMTGVGTTGVQVAAGVGLGADCRMYPVELVGQVRMTLVPERVMASCGGGTGNEKPNTEPGDPRKPSAGGVPKDTPMMPEAVP